MSLVDDTDRYVVVDGEGDIVMVRVIKNHSNHLEGYSEAA
jgi:hypothetical protein